MRNLVVWTLAASCAGSPTTPSSKPTGSDPVDGTDVPTVPTQTTPACDNPWVRSVPEDGEGEVFYLDPVSIELTEPDPTAVLTVAVTGGGSEVPGASTVDGAVVTWVGDPLAPDTDYRATLTHACGTDLLLFTTSDVGGPVEVDLVGRTWALDVADGVWVEPAGAGVALGAILAEIRVLLAVATPPDLAAIDLVAGVGYQGEQNWCAPTIDLDSDWADPSFVSTAPRIDLATHEFSVTIQDFWLSGAFSPDGERIEGAMLAGFADTRGLGAELGLGDAPEAICELLGTFGAACEPCDDGLVTCLTIEITGMAGVLSPTPLVELTPEDVLANPTCTPT